MPRFVLTAINAPEAEYTTSARREPVFSSAPFLMAHIRNTCPDFTSATVIILPDKNEDVAPKDRAEEFGKLIEQFKTYKDARCYDFEKLIGFIVVSIVNADKSDAEKLQQVVAKLLEMKLCDMDEINHAFFC